ncbi:MAG: choice-of-anchor B family protein [Ignavibacteria bacterium]|nr:choice-of-anchor B family protein [Ignavibacteria bacterium]
MKRIFALIFIINCGYTAAQLPDHNTYLLKQIDDYESYSGSWGYVSPGGREYAILGCYEGTSFVDITDSANIHEVDYVPGVGSNWREMKTYSHYAYVVSEGTNSKLQIIDLQYLPDSVSLITSWNYSGYSYTHAISQSGPYLYLSGGNACPNGGVQIIDITNPVAPIRRGNNTLRYVHDVRVWNDTLWACNINNQKVSIINSVDKDALQEVRNVNTLQALPHNCAITQDRKYLLVSYENQDPGMMEIWNIEDIENITYISSWQPTGITTSVIHNVEIFGNIAIAAHYTAGIRIIDISNPLQPQEIAWYDTRPQDNLNSYLGCWAVYKFPSGKIIGSDITNGLFVIKTSFPTNTTEPVNIVSGYSLKQNYPNPFNPETKIEFSIPENTFTELTVFDMLGNETEKLINNEFLLSGTHYAVFSGKDLPSGVYYYRIKAGDFTETKKMLLVK